MTSPKITKHVLKGANRCPTLGWLMARNSEPVSLDLQMRFHQGNYVERVAIDQIGPGQCMPADKDLACSAVCRWKAAASSSSMSITID